MKTFLLKQNFLVVAGIIITLCFSSCILPQRQDANKPQRSITVSGTGTVSVQADSATINFAVITTNRSVIEASRINSEAVAAVRKALIDAGYSAESIVTDRYSITQDVSYRNGTAIHGDYRVANAVHIVVKNISNIGSVIDTAVSAGANEFSSIDFSVTDMESAIREARTNAVKQAYEAANLMVKTAGAELGPIINIEEQRFNGYMPYSAKNNSARVTGVFYDMEEAETTVTPGKQNISVTVVCTYEIQ